MSYSDTDNLTEHLYYGETLNIYKEPFVLGKIDPFVGKTIILRNVCDGTELVYMMESNIDRQIPLDTLPQGFYEVYVMENLVKTRLVSQAVFYDEFYTIRRNNGLGMEVNIVADKNLIESLHELKFKTLGCFCKPKTCHGDIIKKHVELLEIEDTKLF